MKLKQIFILAFLNFWFVSDIYSAELPPPDAPNAAPNPPSIDINQWMLPFVLLALVYGFYKIKHKLPVSSK